MKKIMLVLGILACLALLVGCNPGGQAISGLPSYRSIPTNIIKTGGNNAEGMTCVNHATCGPGFYCSNKGICLKTGGLPEGAECDTTEECEVGLICNNYGFCEKMKAAAYGAPIKQSLTKEIRYETPQGVPSATPMGKIIGITTAEQGYIPVKNAKIAIEIEKPDGTTAVVTV